MSSILGISSDTLLLESGAYLFKTSIRNFDIRVLLAIITVDHLTSKL